MDSMAHQTGDLDSVRGPTTTVISFDIEEHHRIEAAAGLDTSEELRGEYERRMEDVTRRLLDQLAEAEAIATFYIVGEIAVQRPALVRAIRDAGHEIGSHSFDHRRVHRFTPESFRDDLLRSKDALEQASGAEVLGFRAPTFSVTRETAWAVDVLAECGFVYDSSVFPVRHDRYGVPDAPRGPFLMQGERAEILELPPVTYRVLGQNLPVAGGGYFRLFPPMMMRAGLKQLADTGPDAVGMLYFHPWEFDPGQPRLSLKPFSRWRTYVGTAKTEHRLGDLLRRYSFRRAIDVARERLAVRERLPRFKLAA